MNRYYLHFLILGVASMAIIVLILLYINNCREDKYHYMLFNHTLLTRSDTYYGKEQMLNCINRLDGFTTNGDDNKFNRDYLDIYPKERNINYDMHIELGFYRKAIFADNAIANQYGYLSLSHPGIKYYALNHKYGDFSFLSQSDNNAITKIKTLYHNYVIVIIIVPIENGKPKKMAKDDVQAYLTQSKIIIMKIADSFYFQLDTCLKE